MAVPETVHEEQDDAEAGGKRENGRKRVLMRCRMVSSGGHGGNRVSGDIFRLNPDLAENTGYLQKNADIMQMSGG